MAFDPRPGDSCLVLDVRPGEQLSFDEARVNVELIHKSGQIARLRVVAPRGMKVEKICGVEKCQQ